MCELASRAANPRRRKWDAGGDDCLGGGYGEVPQPHDRGARATTGLKVPFLRRTVGRDS